MAFANRSMSVWYARIISPEVEYHYVLIAAARLFGKLPSLISVDFESGLVGGVISGGENCSFFAKGASACVAVVGRNGLGGT